VIIATIFAVMVTQVAPATPAPAPVPATANATQDLESQVVAIDRSGAPQLTDEQRRLLVCARRPPTGSRLARSWCERRIQAEARAQAARESHEAHVLGSGWLDPNAASGGPK